MSRPETGRARRERPALGVWSRPAGAGVMLLAPAALVVDPAAEVGTANLLGWILLLAGAAELSFARKSDRSLDLTSVSGLVSVAAGLFLVLDPPRQFLALSEIILVWLAARGVIQLAAALRIGLPVSRLLVGLAASNLLLAMLLAVDLPVEMLTVLLFGPTAEVRSGFAIVVAAGLALAAAGAIATPALTLRGNADGQDGRSSGK